MLSEIYIEALLVDEDLANQVWEARDAGVITGDLAALAWWLTTMENLGVAKMQYELSHVIGNP